MYHVYDHDDPALTGLVIDETSALEAGHECGVCLDFGYLDLIGPCPGCRPSDYDDHLIEVAAVQLHRTRAEEAGTTGTAAGEAA